MNKEDILNKVTIIFKDVLDDEDLILKTEYTANDVEDWDSLTHIMLVVAIEKHFSLNFTSSEIRNWENVGEMCLAIEGKLS